VRWTEEARAKRQARGNDPLAQYSRPGVAVFRRYLRSYLRRSFNSVRCAAAAPGTVLDRPTVFYVNHPSWWDPVVLLYVLGSLYPGRRICGPIDAAALRHYAVLRHFGLFAIEPGARGAAGFLRQARSVLAEPDTALCVTAQGKLIDVRCRPVALKRGVAHLLAAGIAVQAVPIGLEYAFWSERGPEVLLRMGAAVQAAGTDVPATQRALEAALEATLDALASASIARDEGAFTLLLDGKRRGVGGLYDRWRHLRCALAGRSFDPSHRSTMR
jgi:1-acyl-sn-glycerol-3-phosphate acyltransferase